VTQTETTQDRPQPALDPLWTPLLTHYLKETPGRLDPKRVAAHVRSLATHVSQYLVAGTTGDGWVMDDALMRDWLSALTRPPFGPKQTVLIGAFSGTTASVIQRCRLIEETIAAEPMRPTFAGLTVCAPVGPNPGDAAVVEHFKQILDATAAPIAIYQLPQVVGYEISPEAFATLVELSPRISFMKDSSGGDRLAKTRSAPQGPMRLRGAEGDYARTLKPHGPYDGWLLSTGNALGPELRELADLAAAGRDQEAEERSKALSDFVASVFEAAAKFPHGNAFSNANRALDHILAHGEAWPDAAARLRDGRSLPDSLIRLVATLLPAVRRPPSVGYLDADAT